MARGSLGAQHEGVAALTRASLDRAVPAGDTLLLDTSTLIAYFGDEPTTAAAAAIVDEFVRPGRNRAVICAISATELLIRPLRSGRDELARSILDFLRTFANVDVVPVDLAVAAVAATLRAREGISVPDALIAASGFDRSARVAISDDARWPEAFVYGPTTMRVVALRSLLPLT